MGEINSFDKEYAFLSNFFEAPVVYEGLTYKSNESAFQSAKVLDMEERECFCALNPSTAKRLGRQIALRKDWEQVKDKVMEDIVRDKFTRHGYLKDSLLRTGTDNLVEGNHWNDIYWGICNGVGKNMLGKILMKIRQELLDIVVNETNTDKLIQYYVVNADLGMSIGKTSAQVAHACMIDCEKYRGTELYEQWRRTAITKVILRGTEELLIKLHNDFGYTLIIDKGWTEIAPDSKTVVVAPVMWKSQAPEIIQKLRLL
jgi:hypothetical protein